MTSFAKKREGADWAALPPNQPPQYLIDDSSLRGGTTKQSNFLSSTHYSQKI
jgi:hypothetical protein